MGSIDPPKQRGASYADALRGHKVLAPRPKPAADKKVEVAPIPKDFLKPTQNAAQKTSPEKGPKAAQKKGQKKGAKAAREGDFVAPQPKQSAKASKPKSSAPKTRKDAAQSAKPSSYAEAVRGKTSSITTRPKVEASKKTRSESFPFTEPSTPKSKSRQPSQQQDCRQASTSDKAVAEPADDDTLGWDSRWDDVDSIIRHPAAFQSNQGVQGPALSESSPYFSASPPLTIPYKTHHGRSTQAPRPRIASHAGPGPVHNQRARRFSVGDCSSSFPPSSSSSTLSSTTLAASSQDTLFALLDDSYIEFTIDQAIMSERKRLKMTEEREERIRAVIASHDRGDISLWESQYEWDVLIECGDKSWRVHRDILCRESTYFEERLPPKDPNGGYVTFDCSSHCGVQLAHALYFMYEKTAQTTAMRLHTALNGEPLRRAAFAHIAGASVRCTSMERAALQALHAAALRLKTFFAQTPRHTLERLDLSPLTGPLARALAMAFEQGPRPALFELRAALAHIVDVGLLWWAVNPGFREVLRDEWMPGLWANVCNDAVYFGRCGVLDGLWEMLVVRETVERRRLVEGLAGVTAATPAASRGCGDGGDSGRRSPVSVSSSASRKRQREEGDGEGEADEMGIWRDAPRGEEMTPVLWSASLPVCERDDWTSLDGVPLTGEQLREVHKENLAGVLRRDPIPERPRGGSESGVLRPRENFNEVSGRVPPPLGDGDLGAPLLALPLRRRRTAGNDGDDGRVEVNAGRRVTSSPSKRLYR